MVVTKIEKEVTSQYEIIYRFYFGNNQIGTMISYSVSAGLVEIRVYNCEQVKIYNQIVHQETSESYGVNLAINAFKRDEENFAPHVSIVEAGE